MSSAVFVETLKRNWRQMLYWGIGLGLLGYYIVVVIPNVDMLNQYKKLMESMPPILLQAFGASNLDVMGTPEGFIGFGYLTYAEIVMMVYGVLAGLNITANEEDDGIMDMLLSLPVARWRIIIEKFAVYTLMIIGIIALSFVGLYLGTLSGSLKFDMARIVASVLNVILGIVVVMGLTVFVTTLVRRKTTATIVVVSIIVVSYFVNFLGNAASGTIAASLQMLSFFKYADGQTVVANGFDIGSVLVLLAATIVLIGASLWLWERRDVGI